MAPNHDAAFYSVFGVFTALSTLALGLRIFSRRLKRTWPLVEDYLVAFAWVFAVSQGMMIVVGTKIAGTGRHASQLGTVQEIKEKLEIYGKGYYAAFFLQSTSLALSKLSVLIQLQRIFIIKTWFRRIVYGLYLVVICWWLANMFLSAFLCWPVAANWKPSVPHECGNTYLSLILVPLPWIITDFVILLLPLPVINSLQISGAKKLGVVALFLTGGFTSIVACIRYRFLFMVNETDPTWSASQVGIWNIVESNISVVCACMLVIQPALKAIVLDGLIPNVSSLISKAKSIESLRLQRSGPDDRYTDIGSGRKHMRSKIWKRNAPQESALRESVHLHQIKQPQKSYDFV